MSHCILCTSESERFMKLDGCEIRKCTECGLMYAEPMQLPDSAESFFTDAYNGRIQTPEMRDIGLRLEFMKSRKSSDRSFLLIRGAHKESLKWIKANAYPGSTILDIGCGPGAFLHALRRAGFHSVGIEPSLDVVEILKAEGLEAHRGTIETIPPECPTRPFAITCHYMIHHLTDPVGAVASLRARFPTAYLLLGENYGFRTKKPGISVPPRALTWWRAKSLQLLLTKAGYEAQIIELMPMPEEIYTSARVNELYQRFLKRFLPIGMIWPIWARARKFIFLPAATAERLVKRPPASLLGIGRPIK